MVDARGRPVRSERTCPIRSMKDQACHAQRRLRAVRHHLRDWPDLKSATSTCPLMTSMLVLAALTETRNCVPLTTAAR